eukprot:4638583-Pleurochrysis_carterae.AAC.1
MHALHATLVHCGVFDEIIWARLPPDHSRDAIDRFAFVIERWLRAEGCPEICTPWQLEQFLREKLAASKYRRDVVWALYFYAVLHGPLFCFPSRLLSHAAQQFAS